MALTAIKTVHTLAWFSIESCMMYVLYAGVRGKSDRRAGIAASVVAGESLIFAGNGFRCPLTKLAVNLGAKRGAVTDIFLPRWFAHYLPVIHVPLLLLAIWLHGRIIFGRQLHSLVDGHVGSQGRTIDGSDQIPSLRVEEAFSPA